MHRNPRGIQIAGAFLGIAAAAALHLVTWRSFSDFIRRVDDYRLLFADFVLQYRPAGQEILLTASPYPGYYYSAFFALCLTPLAGPRESEALLAWGVLQVAAGVLLAWFCARFSPARFLGAALFVFLTSAPVLHNFKWGQVSILITALIYACFLAARSGRTVFAAFLLALCAAIKYYPAIFLLPFLARGHKRFSLAFAGWFGVLFFVIPAAILGPAKSIEFHRLSRESWMRDSARHAADVNSQYFPHVAARWQQAMKGQLAPLKSDFSGRAVMVGAGIAVFAGATVLAIKGLGRGTKLEFANVASLLFAGLPFILPTSWPHYFVFLPCAQALAAHEVASEAHLIRRGVLSALLLLSIVLASMIPFAYFSGWRTYSYLGGPFLANALVLAILVRGSMRRGARSEFARP
jgi:hypothetical protein